MLQQLRERVFHHVQRHPSDVVFLFCDAEHFGRAHDARRSSAPGVVHVAAMYNTRGRMADQPTTDLRTRQLTSDTALCSQTPTFRALHLRAIPTREHDRANPRIRAESFLDAPHLRRPQSTTWLGTNATVMHGESHHVHVTPHLTIAKGAAPAVHTFSNHCDSPRHSRHVTFRVNRRT